MKKLISALLTAAMLFGVFAAAPFTVNAAKDVPVSGEVITEADSSVGAILGEAVGRNEQEDHQSESIADVTIDGRTAAVTLMHTKKCMVAVGVYDENDNTLLRTAIQRDISEDCEYIEIGFDNDLPDFYYLRAFILDENCAPIGKQFETNRYTLAYKEFLEKSTEDFPQEKVINFDGDDNNNFAVFDSAVREIDTDGGNRPTKTENSFVFSGADESLLGLREDDIIYFDCGGETELVKVGTVHVSGRTVTITPAEAKMEEVFDYVKIDVTAEEAAADMSEADEGVELVERDENSVGALDTECNFNRSFSFDLTKAMKQGGIEISGAKAELEMKSKMHFRLYYGGDVLETELTDEIEGELDVELGVTAKFSIGLPKLVFPTPVAGLTIAVKPAFEAEISAAFHGKVKIDTRAGFRYNSQSGFANLSQNPKLDAEVNFEGKIYVGFKLTPSIQAAFGVVELGVDIKVGAEGVGKRVITTTDVRESGHTCRWCIDGAINGKVSIEAELSTGLWKKLSYTVSAKLIDWEKKLYDFYYSSDLGFGKGGCPKLDPKTKPQDDPPVYQRMKLDYEEGAYTVNYVVSGDRKHVTAYVTGSGNVSSYNCFGVQKFMDDYNQKTHEKAEEVYPYDWEKQWEYYYDHCILLADSSFGVSIYISGFNAINADTRDYLCPDVHISGSTKVVNISYCKSIQLPDSVEELYIKTIKDFSSFRFPPRLKYIGGFGWCEDLTELTIPSSLEYVDGFLYCPITKLTIMPREKPLVLRDFDHCPIYDLVIPQGVSLLYFHPIDSTLKNITVQTDTKALLRFCKEIEEVHFISPLPSVGDECCNGFRIRGDDLKALLGHQVIQHQIHKQRLDDQAQDGEQSCFHTEGKTGGHRDDDIAAQERDADIQRSIFPKNHRQDIRAAGGSIQVEQDRGTDRRQSHREHQFHQRLGRQRRVQRTDHLQQLQRTGHQQGRVDRTDSEGFPDHRKTKDQQCDVDDRHQRAGRNGRDIVSQHDRDTRNAAGGKMIREFEEIDPGRHDQDTGCNIQPFPGRLSLFFGHGIRFPFADPFAGAL